MDHTLSQLVSTIVAAYKEYAHEHSILVRATITLYTEYMQVL